MLARPLQANRYITTVRVDCQYQQKLALSFKHIIKIIVKKQFTKYSGVIWFCEQVVSGGDLTARESTRGRGHFDFW